VNLILSLSELVLETRAKDAHPLTRWGGRHLHICITKPRTESRTLVLVNKALALTLALASYCSNPELGVELLYIV
jgi:hypothetical protein